MKKIVLALSACAMIAPAASAQVYVDGYVRKDGTYVAPHYRSSPDSTPYNNYSTKGNVNPYTGEVGTRSPYPSYSTPRYRNSTPSYNTYSSPYSTYSPYGRSYSYDPYSSYGNPDSYSGYDPYGYEPD